jgi:hypothetical protein
LGVVDLQPRVVSSESLRFSCTSDAQKESHRDHEVYDAQHCKRITIQSRENGGFSLTS